MNSQETGSKMQIITFLILLHLLLKFKKVHISKYQISEHTLIQHDAKFLCKNLVIFYIRFTTLQLTFQIIQTKLSIRTIYFQILKITS